MSAVRFVDGEERHRALLAGERRGGPSPSPSPSPSPLVIPTVAACRPGGVRVEASLASIPSRLYSLAKAVASLVPQVDVLRVYLNGYDRVPDFLKHKGIVVVRSQDQGDRGDAGKFWWSDKCEGYQLTCDDDFIYPPGYAEKMVADMQRFGRRVALSLHGLLVTQDAVSYYQIPRLSHWRFRSDEFTPQNVLGTGCLIYHPDTISITPKNFELPDMADLWFALACQAQKVPCLTGPRVADWLKLLPTKDSIYDRRKDIDAICTNVMKRVWPWSVYDAEA